MAGLDGATTSKPEAGTSAALEITTTELPEAKVEGVYPPTQLGASGALAPVSWRLTAGELPPGLTLSTAGVVSGQAQCTGIYPFTVEATDGLTSASRCLALAVDTFGTSMDGLNFGEAWAGEPITLDAVGCTSPTTFEVVRNDSGGAFDHLDEAAGRAVWVPGGNVPAADLIRVTDTESGAVSEVEVAVVAHPAPHYVAEFGSTDVWYVNASHGFGPHGLPRDWDDALVMVGLRSTSYVPTLADEMASWLVRRRLLATLNVLFGRNEDGTRGDGVAISFPFKRPKAPYTAPLPGTWATGAPGRYNVMSLVHGSNRSIAGFAFQDGVTNERVENDTTSADHPELGVHVNQIAYFFNAGYQNNTLPYEPVSPADEPILRALIHGDACSGARAEMLQWVIQGLGESLAGVVAHEIGHSLGLEHTTPSVPTSIMGSSSAISPYAKLRFVTSDMDQLRSILPGPGRMGGSQKTGDASLPPGGIAACRLPIHAGPAPAPGKSRGCCCGHAGR
jgi:hypothetical protein